MEKRGRERKQSYPRCHARLCERADSLKALDSVAIYLENGDFYQPNFSRLLDSACYISLVYNLLRTQLFLIQNHFQTLVHIPAHFAKAVFLVEPLGRNL